MASKKNAVITAASSAGLISLIVYLRALSCGFVNLDDPDYVLNNPLVRHLDWNLVVLAFSQAHIGWWMPLTWISFAIDYHFWGMSPFGFHLTNILLHAINTALVVLIADRVIRGSEIFEKTVLESKLPYSIVLLFAGILFGIHPLRVESVVWVTERKDVLNGLFSLGSLLFYMQYAIIKKRSDCSRCHVFAYLLSLSFFALSLMAKSVSVVVPIMLLVIDWFPLGRLRKGEIVIILIEKIPFLLLSIVMSAVTFYFTAESRYLVSYDVFPFGQRVIVSGNAIFEYCRLLVFPVGILPLHVIPDPIPVSYFVKTGITLIFGCICVAYSRQKPALCATWLLFMMPLLPVLAFFQNGDQAFASRFTYLPALAPSIAAAVMCMKIFTREKISHQMTALKIMMICIVLIFATITVRLVAVWKDSESLWSRVIDVKPDVIAYKERGKLFYQDGKYDAAIQDFTEALKIATGVFYETRYNLYAFRAEAYRVSERFGEAVADYTTAISMFPHTAYYYHRGLALLATGKIEDAKRDFHQAGANPGPIDWYYPPK